MMRHSYRMIFTLLRSDRRDALTSFLSIKPDTVGDFCDARVQEFYALTGP